MTNILNTTTPTFLQETTFIFYTIAFGWINILWDRRNSERLFESYLNGRQQYVDFDGTPSNSNRIITGVPQGSILGPLLFIIYINDIAQSSKHFNFIIYADDTTLCSTLKINADATQLNMELNNVYRWLNLSKLS